MTTPAALTAGPPARQLTRPSPDGTRRPATFAQTVRLLATIRPESDDEAILAAWSALGPNPAAVARAVGLPVRDVLDLMGRAAAAGLTTDTGWPDGPDPTHDDPTLVKIDAVAKSLVLDGTVEAAPDPTVALDGGHMCRGRTYRIRPGDVPVEPAAERPHEALPTTPTWMPRPEDVPVGDRIRAGRHTLGLTQDQLAERIGVIASTVSWWETGRSTPSRDNRRALDRAGIPLDM